MSDCGYGPARQEERALWKCGIAEDRLALWVSAGGGLAEIKHADSAAPPGAFWVDRLEEETSAKADSLFVPACVCVCVVSVCIRVSDCSTVMQLWLLFLFFCL